MFGQNDYVCVVASGELNKKHCGKKYLLVFGCRRKQSETVAIGYMMQIECRRLRLNQIRLDLWPAAFRHFVIDLPTGRCCCSHNSTKCSVCFVCSGTILYSGFYYFLSHLWLCQCGNCPSNYFYLNVTLFALLQVFCHALKIPKRSQFGQPMSLNLLLASVWRRAVQCIFTLATPLFQRALLAYLVNETT